MRKVAVWGFVLVAVAVVFTGAHGYAPILLQPPTKTAQEVEVTNFPAVQPVNGTVSVGNLPAVQPVSGSVQVNNLPLDGDGNLKVMPVAPSPTYKLIKIADQLPLANQRDAVVPVGTYNVAGYHRVTVLARITIDPLPGTNWCLQIQSVASLDGSQFPVGLTPLTICSSDIAYTTAQYATNVDFPGPEVTVTTMQYSPTAQAVGTASLDAWLYLSN